MTNERSCRGEKVAAGLRVSIQIHPLHAKDVKQEIREPIPGAPDLFPTAAAVVSPFSEVILTVSALNRESGVNINTGWAYRWNKRDARCGLNACGNYTRWTRRERQGFAGQVAQRVAILAWYKKQTFVTVGRAMEECSALSMDI